MTLIEDNTTISGNVATIEGGGILTQGPLTVLDSTIGGPASADGNSGSAGGGIADRYSGTITINDCLFEYNIGPNQSNGAAGEGRALYATSGITVTDCTFIYNSAWTGGAIISFRHGNPRRLYFR